ncbi:MAG TPA: retropepsin-like aspartic protease [Thermoanaerobaculia bacterium]
MRLLALVLLAACAKHEVPLVRADNLPLFEVRVQGQPLWFLLDTGSPYTFLDPQAAARLGLRSDGHATVHGAGGGAVEVETIKEVAMQIGDVDFRAHDVRTTDLRGIAEMIGHPLDGFLGYEFLSAHVVTVAHDRMSIDAEVPKGVTLPIRFGGKTQKWIYIPGTIKVPGNDPVTSDFFVDSGSSDGANHPIIRRSTGPLHTIRGGNGLGAAGSEAMAGRAEWLRLGTLEVKDVSSQCCGGMAGTEAAIGQGVLSQFVVTYDYARSRVILSRSPR